ncbi:MAG: hypothetical protein VB875_10915, partial [Pirellulales bacterium]
PPTNMLVAMGLAAAACVVIGLFPNLLYLHLPFAADYAPYTLQHVTSTLGMLAFTALGFFLLLKHLDPEPKISLDTDWFYRRGSSIFLTLTGRPLARLESGFVGEIYEFIMQRLVLVPAVLLRKFDTSVVDFAAVGVGRLTKAISQIMSTTATGNAQHYGLIMAAGVLALFALTMLVL